MNDSLEELIENSWSRMGLRTVHVARMGGAVERGRWLEQLPVGAFDTLTVCEYVEKPLRVSHLWMWWNAREVVEFMVGDRRFWGVMWWIGKGNFREAAREAALRYFLDLGKDAQIVACRSLPKGAPRKDGQAEPIRLEVLGKEVEVRLVEVEWAPERCVVALGSEEEAYAGR